MGWKWELSGNAKKMGLNDTFINYDTYIYHTLGLIFNLSVTLISYYVLIMKKYILKNHSYEFSKISTGELIQT